MPARNVSTQQFQSRLGIAPGLGRKYLNALCQQHRGLALHLHAVLQVFDDFDTVSNLHLQQRQRLPRQRRTGLRCIALPCQGIGNVELGGRQQSLGFVCPFSRDGLLALGTADFVQSLADRTGSTLVTTTQLFEHFLQLLRRRLCGQPLADTRRPLSGRGCRERATGQCIQWMRLMGFGRGRIHFRCVGHFAAGKKWKHGSNGLRRHPGRRARGRARATAPSARQGNKSAIFTGLGQRL
mgnify:CR=1 FL=1